MKNNFRNILIFFILIILINFPATKANDEIVFDITELEITNNGNLIIGKKNGKALLNDGSVITAENFKYNKLTDILEVNGNVEFENETKDIKIFSQSAIYNKNNEEIVTKGNSKAINIDNTITAENFNIIN